VYERFGPGAAIVEGARQTWDVAALVLFSLKGMVVGDISVRELGGPVVIADASAQAARAGLRYLLWFMAFLSVNLAVLNLLPIPVLDGGHIVYFLLEMIFRRPVSDRWKAAATRVGILILLMLMSLAIFNDVRRLLS
jgi:regulator of sigma E protease